MKYFFKGDCKMKRITKKFGFILLAAGLAATVSNVRYSKNNQRYLLIYQDIQRPAEIYNSDGTKISEITLTGEACQIADDGRIIVKASDENNANIWKVLDENGFITFEIPEELSVTGAKFIDTDKVLAWGKNTENNSTIAVYNNSDEKLYEKVFTDSTTNIEQVTADICSSKFVTFTSKEVYDYDDHGDYDYGYDGYHHYVYNNRQMSVSVIDYLQGTIVSSDILKTDQDISIDAVLSENGNTVAAVINNSDLFAIDIATAKIRYSKTLTQRINGSSDGDVIQVKATDDGNVHILRFYSWPKSFVVYEVHNAEGQTAQINVFEDMDSGTRMSIDGSRVTISCKDKTETFYL
jgi:hypothetical protein